MRQRVGKATPLRLVTDDAPLQKQFFKLVDLKSPPLSVSARIRVGELLRYLENGEKLEEPDWKPMTKSIGPGCGELRVRVDKKWWRVVCYVDAKFVIVLHLFLKQTDETPDAVRKLCQNRLRNFKAIIQG